MATSKEWKEWHLTPSGWVGGSERTDFAPSVNIEPPNDRVLSCLYKETLPSPYSSLETSAEVTWSSDDKELIKKFIKEFGKCPNHL
ncbi:hypothetical protein JCM14076_28270 [Methylosoma difficile]